MFSLYLLSITLNSKVEIIIGEIFSSCGSNLRGSSAEHFLAFFWYPIISYYEAFQRNPENIFNLQSLQMINIYVPFPDAVLIWSKSQRISDRFVLTLINHCEFCLIDEINLKYSTLCVRYRKQPFFRIAKGKTSWQPPHGQMEFSPRGTNRFMCEGFFLE